LDNGVIPNTEDKKSQTQVSNCQLNILTPGQQESASTDGVSNLPNKTTSTADTATVTAARTNADNNSKVDCQIDILSADFSIVQPCNDSLELSSNVTTDEAPKAAGVAKKKKKTVTFSDNIELVASAADVTDPVDYMLYAASIGRQANSTSVSPSTADSVPTTKNGVDTPSICCTNSDNDIVNDSSDETDDEKSEAPSGRVRCSLCRQKWVELTDTYCSDCSFYLSRLQMST